MYRFSIIILIALVGFTSTFAQTSERKLLRKGNKAYADSLFIPAETNYRKAIEIQPGYARAHYNLGNALLWQQKPKEAMEAFETASKLEEATNLKGDIQHNMGVILQSQKQYGPAIDCYKEALRNNPEDNEARYNLALCQYMLKNQQQQDKQQKQDKEEEDKEKEQQQNKEDKKENDQSKEQQPEQKQSKQPEQEQEMSKENAEQLLNAAKQDEKNTQEKLKKALQQSQRRKLEKQW